MAFDPSYSHKLVKPILKWHARLPAVDHVTAIRTHSVFSGFNTFYGGVHKVVGTVKYKNTPTNTPLHRIVYLLREPDMRIIASTWSDATTGAYSFFNIDGSKRYTVLSVDYARNYRAVIADNLAPEAM